jgi:glycerophosphoryl diester phosphodiesterase
MSRIRVRRLVAVCLVLMTAPSVQLSRGAEPGPGATASNSNWNVRGNLAPEKFVIQSHRGAGDLAPENTLEAFELGWKLGTYPECDVRTTRDGRIVTFHDNDFSRVVKNMPEGMKGKGVADVTWEELSKLDVGTWKGEQFEGHRVRTIGEVLERMTGRPERHLYLDIKNVDLARLAAEVRAHRVEVQVVLASTKYEQIRQWKALVPQSDTLVWMGGTEAALRQRLADLREANFADVTQLQIHVRMKSGADVAGKDAFTPSDAFLAEVGRELRSRNIVYQCLPWGGSDPKVYWKLLDLGVMSFATDHPDVTADAVRRYYAGSTTGGGK